MYNIYSCSRVILHVHVCGCCWILSVYCLESMLVFHLPLPLSTFSCLLPLDSRDFLLSLCVSLCVCMSYNYHDHGSLVSVSISTYVYMYANVLPSHTENVRFGWSHCPHQSHWLHLQSNRKTKSLAKWWGGSNIPAWSTQGKTLPTDIHYFPLFAHKSVRGTSSEMVTLTNVLY